MVSGLGMLFVVMVLVLIWTAVVLASVWLVGGSRYPGRSGTQVPVKARLVRQEAEEKMMALTPRMMVLAGKMRTVEDVLGGKLPSGDQRVEQLLREAAAYGLWRRYTAASMLVDEEPLVALEELAGLPERVEAAISKLEEAGQPVDGREGSKLGLGGPFERV